MPQFKVTAAEQITLDNHNRLVHLWNPASQEHNRLRYQHSGIEIYPCQSQPYQEDLVTLLIHFEDLGALLARRINAIDHPENVRLQNLYQLGQLYQGLRVLLAQTNALLLNKMLMLQDLALAKLPDLDANEQLIVQKLVTDVRQAQVDFARLQLEIAANQKIATMDTKLIYGLITAPGGQLVPTSFAAPLTTNKEITLADFERAQCRLQITTKLQCNFSLSFPQTRPTFADLTHFNLYEDGKRLPISMLVYPKWPHLLQDPRPMKLIDFQACPQGAHSIFQFNSTEQASGKITYQPPQLAVLLAGPYANDAYSEQLPYYFQAIVEIAKRYHCYEIALYIPNDFTVKAYAYGFYSSDESMQQLCKEVVTEHLTAKQAVPLLTADTNAFENGAELLRPVFLTLGELMSRPVYFTEQGIATTYDALCQKPLFSKAEQQPLLPDPYGFLTRPFCSLYQALKTREISGNPIPTTVATFNTELTDINWIKTDKDLIGLGEAGQLQPDTKTTALRLLR